jgi:hypothetical protein
MRGERGRNPSGPLREKRGDTILRNIPELDHKELPISRNARLDTLREEIGEESLKRIIRKLPAKDQ